MFSLRFAFTAMMAIALSQPELRVWVGNWEHPAIAGFVVSNSLVRKCTLPVDSANSSAGHSTEHKPRAGRRYFAPLKKLESFNAGASQWKRNEEGKSPCGGLRGNRYAAAATAA
jgi:hypothetical protein